MLRVAPGGGGEEGRGGQEEVRGLVGYRLQVRLWFGSNSGCVSVMYSEPIPHETYARTHVPLCKSHFL